MREPGTLIKFGQEKHLLQLQNEGLLYMNNLPYFWKMEDDELRGDPCDCVAEIARGPKIAFTLADGKQFFMEGEWTLRIPPVNPEKVNIFSMYSLRPLAENTFPINEKNFRFGDHALLLIKPEEFMRRLEFSLKSQRIVGNGDLVEYVDDEYAGKVGPFRKFSKFNYQSEWRLVCKDGPGGPRKIYIGSIQDISVIIRSDVLNKELRIEFESGKGR
jgi:hypothetical protein